MKKNNKKPKIRKYLPKYPNGDVFGAQDLNQPITNNNSGIYSDGTTGETYGTNNNQMNAGQYVAMGQAGIEGGAGVYGAYNTPGMSDWDKQQQSGKSIQKN